VGRLCWAAALLDWASALVSWAAGKEAGRSGEKWRAGRKEEKAGSAKKKGEGEEQAGLGFRAEKEKGERKELKISFHFSNQISICIFK
jgi:hypothetical protein